MDQMKREGTGQTTPKKVVKNMSIQLRIPDVSVPLHDPEIYSPSYPEILTPHDPEPDRREVPNEPERTQPPRH
jgi:hypothetical protein